MKIKVFSILIFIALLVNMIEGKKENKEFLKFFQDNEPEKYTEIVKLLNDQISNNNDFKNHAFNTVAYFVDTFGPRLFGSEALEDALSYMRDLLISEGFENVKLEPVPLKKRWIRGKEQMTLFKPRPFPTNIPMIGLGGAIGGNVTSTLVLLHSFEELEEKGSKGLLKDKIAFFNPKWTNYGNVVQYRSRGASESAKWGAVACIIRSVASKSIENPHTGIMRYDPNYPQIPAAAVSIETADMFERMIKRGQEVEINLYMEDHWEEGDFLSHNLIGEITGSTYPNEIILLGGHIDSWDVGPQTGANDDAAGFMVCFEAVRLLIKNNLRPLRTIRFIAWTGEEFSNEYSGNLAYMNTHKDEMDDHIVAFESDEGTTDIFGFGFTGGLNGMNLIKSIADTYLKEIKAGQIDNDGEMVDNGVLYDYYNVPVMKNLVRDTADYEYYFTYHHSAGDTINVLNPVHMDRNALSIAAMFYIIGDMELRLPRD